jgi:hypothetical protein
MRVGIFWGTAPCGPYVNRRFGESITSIFMVENHPSKKPAGRWLAYFNLEDSQKMAAFKTKYCSVWCNSLNSSYRNLDLHTYLFNKRCWVQACSLQNSLGSYSSIAGLFIWGARWTHYTWLSTLRITGTNSKLQWFYTYSVHMFSAISHTRLDMMTVAMIGTYYRLIA